MFPHSNQGGNAQLPTHWQPPSSQAPANGSYPPPSHMTASHPPPPQEPRPDLAAHQHPDMAHQHAQHPQYQQPYRLPGPSEWSHPQSDPYRQQPPPPPHYVQQQQQHHHQPPAPRQRTAIACRYCRRRKIRCSGFEATEDGRCSNCMRFNQDCIFTPVSAQTQAFVPAHTVWRGVGQPPPMYGAYGQPLPPAAQAEAYGQPPRQQQYLPSPTAGPYPVPSQFGPHSAPHDEASGDELNGRKRPHPEPHTPTLPPPAPGSAIQAPHRGAAQNYTYPEPPSLTPGSTAPPAASYTSAPPAPQPYYTAQPRQASPQGSFRYEPSRTSSSPQSQAPTTPGAAPSPYYNAPPPAASAPLQAPPPRSDGRTPPPSTSASSTTSRPSMRINDLVSDNGAGRSSTDSSMLNKFNRRPM